MTMQFLHVLYTRMLSILLFKMKSEHLLDGKRSLPLSKKKKDHSCFKLIHFMVDIKYYKSERLCV